MMAFPLISLRTTRKGRSRNPRPPRCSGHSVAKCNMSGNPLKILVMERGQDDIQKIIARLYCAIALFVNAFLIHGPREGSSGCACFEPTSHVSPQISIEPRLDLANPQSAISNSSLNTSISFPACFFENKYCVPRIPAAQSIMSPEFQRFG